jgi:hypothetical protein
MRKIQDFAAALFLGAVIALTALSILGVWEVYGRDVITKSFMTIGLLAVVAVIVIVAGRFMEHKDAGVIVVEPSPIFKSIRQMTVALLIVSVALLALVGILAIWELITDKTVLYKVLSSLGILSFGSLISVMTCLERENKFQNNPAVPGSGSKWGIGRIIGTLVVIWICFSLFGFLFSFGRYF